MDTNTMKKKNKTKISWKILFILLLLFCSIGYGNRFVVSVSAATTAQERYPNFSSEEEMVSYIRSKYPATRTQDIDGKHYGCCWAIAATTLVEFYMASHDMCEDGRNLNFSETALAYTAYHPSYSSYNGKSVDKIAYDKRAGQQSTWLGIGGNLSWASYILMTSGAKEDAGPYAFEKATSALTNGFSMAGLQSSSAVQLWNYRRVNMNKYKNQVKQFIRENGAVGVMMHYDTSMFSGISYYCNEKRTQNHSVVLVGYDDSYPASKFKNKPAGNGAWLVRNSYKENDGLSKDGYFWISYYDQGLKACAHVYEVADKDREHDGVFSYNQQVSNIETSEYKTVANIYTSSVTTYLYAVQLDYISYKPGHYLVKVYKNLTDPTKPTSGTCVAKASGYEAYPGRFSILLNKAIQIKQGERFSIVVQSDRGVQREVDNIYKKQVTMDVTMHRGESFAKVNGAWKDLMDISYDGTVGNFCIRGLAMNDVPLNRIYACENPTNGAVEYTNSLSTAKKWKNQGWECHRVFFCPSESNVKVYSIQMENSFLLTTDRDFAIFRKKTGDSVNVAFYGSEKIQNPVYEMYRNGVYRYVLTEEANQLSQQGWIRNRIAFYASP